MKRFFFSLIALSAAAIGCTQSALLETPEIFNQEVSFSPYTGRTPVTKAESADLSYLQKPSNQGGGFYVYCFLDKKDGSSLVTYINDEYVEYKTNAWSYDKLVYWPDKSSNSTLSFVAYSANAVGKGLTPSSTSGFTYTVPTDIDSQVDLLATAYQKDLNLNSSTDKVSATGQVQLKFYHLLSKVGFKAKTTTDKLVTINSLSLYGKQMATSGTLTFTDAEDSDVPALKVNSTKENNITYTYLPETADENISTSTISNAFTEAQRIPRLVKNDRNEMIASEYMMIMPQKVENLGDMVINVNYTIGSSSSSKSKSAQVKLPAGFTFVAGTAYEFILNISTSAIKFEVEEVKDWGDPDEDNNSFPLIPETQDKLAAVATVKDQTSADIMLTPKEAGLGTIGVQWRVMPSDPEATWGTDNMKPYSDSYEANKSYTIPLTGLNANTTYQYRPYSTSGGTTTYYSVGMFTTKSAITVDFGINGSVAEIYHNKVTLRCNFTTSGECTEFGFCLVKGSGLPTTGGWEPDEVSTLNKDNKPQHTFTATYNNLEPLTMYTCRAYVVIDGILSYSEPTEVWTAPEPTVDSGEDNNEGEGEKPEGPPADSWEEDGTEIPF